MIQQSHVANKMMLLWCVVSLLTSSSEAMHHDNVCSNSDRKQAGFGIITLPQGQSDTRGRSIFRFLPVKTSEPLITAQSRWNILSNNLRMSNNDNDAGDVLNVPKKKKKKKKFVINPDILEEGVVSSNGLLEDRINDAEKKEPVVSNLGVSSRKKIPKDRPTKKMSEKKARIEKQRTAAGTVNSTARSMISDPESQDVQVQTMKRGSKVVTIVRGLTSTTEDRKVLLKEMKTKLGGGGTLVEGVIELQGSHADMILSILLKKGYSKTKKIGK